MSIKHYVGKYYGYLKNRDNVSSKFIRLPYYGKRNVGIYET